MLHLFRAELTRNWIMLRRYSGEAISGVIGLTIVFYGLFLSAQYVAGGGQQFGDRLDTIVVGYVLWTLVIFVISDISQGLQQEAQTGTLEQLFLSPFGAPRIFLMRGLTSLSTQFVLIISILLLIMAITGSRLSFPPLLILPLITVLLGAYGVALSMGALALLLKRVQQISGILQFLLFPLLMVPIESWAGAAKFLGLLLPMTPGSGLLRELMARNQGLDLTQLLLALINGIVYFAIGLSIFYWAEREVKRRGKLAGY
jgi:ABC-2 type transport system permease protein